ncbi:hypothetical protein [Curtobacterium citreum]|uniref:Uncharacterized protein n=1 Tax=Curtobacterium citreum TaxID=2036 RepID=A0ABU8Y9F3_9MICO
MQINPPRFSFSPAPYRRHGTDHDDDRHDGYPNPEGDAPVGTRRVDREKIHVVHSRFRQFPRRVALNQLEQFSFYRLRRRNNVSAMPMMTTAKTTNSQGGSEFPSFGIAASTVIVTTERMPQYFPTQPNRL